MKYNSFKRYEIVRNIDNIQELQYIYAGLEM